MYNFDQHGYHLERWREAISVPLEQIGDFDAALRAHDKIHRDRGVPCVPLGFRAGSVLAGTRSQRGVRRRYQDSGHNCYHYAVSFLNHVRYRGRTDHTIQSIERELLTPPCLEAIAYLNKCGAQFRYEHQAAHCSSGTLGVPRYKKVTSSPRTICCEVDAAGNAVRRPNLLQTSAAASDAGSFPGAPAHGGRAETACRGEGFGDGDQHRRQRQRVSGDGR